MELNTDRIDAAVLALLLLGLHDGCRVWKTFDWDAMNRLHEKGFISDPVSKAKSVVITVQGQREAERLFRTMFAAYRSGQSASYSPPIRCSCSPCAVAARSNAASSSSAEPNDVAAGSTRPGSRVVTS